MKRIAVAGYFGWGNFGDQLFLDTVLRRREELWPGSTGIVSLSTKNLARHATSGPLGALIRALHTVRIARSADVLAYCGGSVFGEVSGVDALRRRFRPARLQALGVSVGPFTDPGARLAVKEYLADFERIVVRDDSWVLLQEGGPAPALPVHAAAQVSAAQRTPEQGRVLEQRGVFELSGAFEHGGDLAALSPLIAPVSPTAREGLVVCPSAAAASDIETLTHQVVQARDALLARGRSVRVRLLALNGHPRWGDVELVRAVAASLRSLGIDSETSSFLDLGLEATVTMLTSAELVLSQRLHGAIVAYLSGGRFVMIDHHPKCRAFVEDVTGSTQVCVPVDAPDLSIALTAALDPAQALSWEPRDYIGRAQQVYLRQPTHA